MKRNYVIQYNNGRHSCGPIALLNALKFQGHDVGRRHLPWLARKLKCNGRGTHYMQFEQTGRRLGALKRLRKASHRRVEAQLMAGNGVAVQVSMVEKDTGDVSAHVFLLTGITIRGDEVWVQVANLGHRCGWTTWEHINELYQLHYDDHWFAAAWTVPLRGKQLRIPA